MRAAFWGCEQKDGTQRSGSDCRKRRFYQKTAIKKECPSSFPREYATDWTPAVESHITGGTGESGIRRRHKPVKAEHYGTHKKDKKNGGGWFS